MPLNNAEKCKNYRKRKKDAALKIKTTPKTSAERSRMYRLRKKQLAQGSKLSPSTSNLQMTFEPSPQPVTTDLQYSDSGSSGLEEGEQKDGIETVVQVTIKVEVEPSAGPSSYATNFPIKREIPDETPQVADELADYTYSIKEEPMEPDMNMETPLDLPVMWAEPPHIKEEPLDNWQPDPAIQDDFQVTGSKEEPEDGLWF